MNPPTVDIKDNLEGQSSALGLVFGDDLHIGTMPDTPDLCVCLYDTGGNGALAQMREDEPMIQVRVRGKQNGYPAAYSLAEDVKEAIRELHNTTINSTKYIGCWPTSEIAHVGNDNKGRPELTVNFRIKRTE